MCFSQSTMWLPVVNLFLISEFVIAHQSHDKTTCQFEELECENNGKTWCKEPSEFCRPGAFCQSEERICDGLRQILHPAVPSDCGLMGYFIMKNITIEMCGLLCTRRESCNKISYLEVSEECFVISTNGSVNSENISVGSSCYSLVDNEIVRGRERRQLFTPFQGLANLFSGFFGNGGSGNQNQFRNQFNQLRSQLGNQFESQSGNQFGNQFGNQLGNQFGNQFDQFGNQFRGQLPNQFMSGRNRMPQGRAIQFNQDTLGNSFTQVQCGVSAVLARQGKVINGREVQEDAIPWQAAIKRRRDSSSPFEHICGGSVVSENYVLTAAHCIVGYDKSNYRIVVGGNALFPQEAKYQIFDAKQLIIHERYNAKAYYNNDVALIRVNSPIQLTDGVRPVCLPPDASYEREGLSCIVSGWGLTKAEDGTSLSRTLRAAKVPIMSKNKCRQQDYMGSLGPFKSVEDGMFCAGYDHGGIDACKGDSGGPLACNINGLYYLVGITSWGEGCARDKKPGIYTSVSFYLPWIRSKMS